MTHSQDDEFKVSIEAFLERTDIAPSSFGSMSCGDPNFVFDLRGGEREFKRSTIEKVNKWMSGFESGVTFAVQGKLPVERVSSGVEVNPAPVGA